jgi:mannose-6-phosphate isomerase-like protein (cupin superfamily)
MKIGYFAPIESLTKENEAFRQVLYTAESLQLVLMSLPPGEDIGVEVHEENDQFFRFESGMGRVVVNDAEYDVKDGDCVVIPKGSAHNIINTSDTESLKMYTIYTPPHHKDGTIHSTKEYAEEHEEEYEGVTTEE